MTTRLPRLWELLAANGLTGPRTLALRHKPGEPQLKRSFVDLIERRPDLFNAYQSYQERRVDSMFTRAQRVISFYGDLPGRATLIGVYEVAGRRVLPVDVYWSDPLNAELRSLGMVGPDFFADKAAFHDLAPMAELADLRGRLVVDWPGREVTWAQWVDDREDRFRVSAVESSSRFDPPPRPWRDLSLTWTDLAVMSPALRQRLQEWRGVYFIHDVERRLSYVGSAYGEDNLLGRWLNYSRTGDGGNKGLAVSNPCDLRFSILELTAPSLAKDDRLGEHLEEAPQHSSSRRTERKLTLVPAVRRSLRVGPIPLLRATLRCDDDRHGVHRLQLDKHD